MASEMALRRGRASPAHAPPGDPDDDRRVGTARKAARGAGVRSDQLCEVDTLASLAEVDKVDVLVFAQFLDEFSQLDARDVVLLGHRPDVRLPGHDVDGTVLHTDDRSALRHPTMVRHAAHCSSVEVAGESVDRLLEAQEWSQTWPRSRPELDEAPRRDRQQRQRRRRRDLPHGPRTPLPGPPDLPAAEAPTRPHEAEPGPGPRRARLPRRTGWPRAGAEHLPGHGWSCEGLIGERACCPEGDGVTRADRLVRPPPRPGDQSRTGLAARAQRRGATRGQIHCRRSHMPLTASRTFRLAQCSRVGRPRLGVR